MVLLNNIHNNKDFKKHDVLSKEPLCWFILLIFLLRSTLNKLLKWQPNCNIHAEKESCAPQVRWGRQSLTLGQDNSLRSVFWPEKKKIVSLYQLWQIRPSYSGIKTSKMRMRNEILIVTFNNLSYYGGLSQTSINYCLFEGPDLYD